MNRGEKQFLQKPVSAKRTKSPSELSKDLAATTRQIFSLHRTADPVRRASLCQRAARLHFELSRGQQPSVRRHRQERAVALLREAIALTNPAYRYHRAKLMLQCARLYRNLDRNEDDRLEACDLMNQAASLMLKHGRKANARQIANEARDLADEYGIGLILPAIPPPLKHRRR